jgi:hypothetical protein
VLAYNMSQNFIFSDRRLQSSTPEHISWCLQLGLKFPKPGAEAAHQHIIDMKLHPEASLMAAQGHTFPLIIRLETITEDGAKSGHSLQVSAIDLQCLETSEQLCSLLQTAISC